MDRKTPRKESDMTELVDNNLCMDVNGLWIHSWERIPGAGCGRGWVGSTALRAQCVA